MLLTFFFCDFDLQKLGLGECWLVFEGEADKNGPILCVRKHVNVNILQGNRNRDNNNVEAYVYRGISDKRHAFCVEGCYASRTCKVVDEMKEVVAEIKRKEANCKGVSFGMDVFQLVVQPGFDAGFAMALVLLLDQMFS